jgi:hypothetical protein
VSQIIEASQERLYLSFRLALDPSLVGSVMVEAGHFAPRSRADVRAINVSPFDASLLDADAVVRLVRLPDTSVQASFLALLIMRETVYRSLMGEQGGRLRHIAIQGGHTHRIARVIERPGREFDQPLRADDVTRELGMSVSSFHHHFRAVTAVSSLQFKKRVSTRQVMATAWVTTTPHTSIGRTEGFSVYRRCATWNGSGKPPAKALAVISLHVSMRRAVA